MTLLALFPSTAYLLAYALPLVFLSLLVTLAGAFLTLDRTRVFAPRADAGYDAAVHYTARSRARAGRRGGCTLLMEGGVGGLAGGYLFGLHASTFLALLIPAVTTSAPLTHKSFVAVWILSVIPTAALGARWRYAALALLGVTGGVSLGLALSVITHPNLLSRIVLVSILAPLLTVAVMLPIERTQHGALRLATASTGSFGVILAIALLSHVPGWGDVWERLWLSDSLDWGTSKEKGLSAAYCIILAVGTLCDWLLRHRYGENPDQKWDNYLANYASNLPNSAHRAGIFHPSGTFFDRLLHHKASDPASLATEALLSPSAHDLKDPLPGSPASLHKYRSDSQHSLPGAFEYAARPGALRKKSTAASPARLVGKAGTRSRVAIKFRPGDVLSSSDEDSDGDDTRAPPSPWAKPRSSTGSSTTLHGDAEGKDSAAEKPLDVGAETAAIARRLGRVDVRGAPEYSDHSDLEEDVAASAKPPAARGAPDWTPGFIRKHRDSVPEPAPAPARSHSGSSVAVSSGFTHGSGHDPLRTPPVDGGGSAALRAVPATPSLIRAIDRITVAQEAAYGYGFPRAASPPVGLGQVPVPVPRGLGRGAAGDDAGKGDRWHAFWRDVKEKAAKG